MDANKYIIVDRFGIDVPVLFPDTLQHKDVALGIKISGDEIISAGFVVITDDTVLCYGESIGLGIKSRGESDTVLLRKLLGR